MATDAIPLSSVHAKSYGLTKPEKAHIEPASTPLHRATELKTPATVLIGVENGNGDEKDPTLFF